MKRLSKRARNVPLELSEGEDKSGDGLCLGDINSRQNVRPTNRQNQDQSGPGRFSDPLLLIATMCDTRSVISRSRAADIVAPGSCGDTDWDCYCPRSAECTSAMMEVLESCGVMPPKL